MIHLSLRRINNRLKDNGFSEEYYQDTQRGLRLWGRFKSRTSAQNAVYIWGRAYNQELGEQRQMNNQAMPWNNKKSKKSTAEMIRLKIQKIIIFENTSRKHLPFQHTPFISLLPPLLPPLLLPLLPPLCIHKNDCIFAQTLIIQPNAADSLLIKQTNYDFLQQIQHFQMEEILIYDIQSENNESQPQNDHQDFEPSKISSKETESEQILATRTIQVRSNSSEQSPTKPQYYQHSFKHMQNKQENIIFYEQDMRKSQSSIDADQTNRKFLKRKVESDDSCSDQYYDQVEELQKLNEIEQEEEAQHHKTKIVPPQTVLKNKAVLVTANVDVLIRQIVPQGYKLTYYLQARKGLLGFSGVYRLFLGKEKQFVLAAKKEVFKYYSNFLISRHHSQIHKRSQIYVGRLEGNFVGTQFKLYSVKEQFQNMKLLINYDKNIVGFAGLRSLRAVKINPELKNVKYFSNLADALEKNEKSKLVQLSTAQPTLKKGKFRLDFKGKVKVPSSKNFILNDDSGKQCLLFGKISEGEYIVEVSYPLTAFEAFGLCLSSLDSKLLVN